MAKTQNPLFSLTAHGTIARNLTYSKKLSAQLTRWQKKNRDAQSAAQSTERTLFNAARNHWNTLTQTEKALWKEWNNGD